MLEPDAEDALELEALLLDAEELLTAVLEGATLDLEAPLLDADMLELKTALEEDDLVLGAAVLELDTILVDDG